MLTKYYIHPLKGSLSCPKSLRHKWHFCFLWHTTCGHHLVEDSYNNYNVFHLYIQLKVHTAVFLFARPLKVHWGHLYTGSVLCTSSHTSSKSSSYSVSAIHSPMPLCKDSGSFFFPARGQLRSSSTCTFYMHVTPMGLDAVLPWRPGWARFTWPSRGWRGGSSWSTFWHLYRDEEKRKGKWSRTMHKGTDRFVLMTV